MIELYRLPGHVLYSGGYDAVRGDLYLCFHRSGLYVWHGVDPMDAAALLTGGGLGGYVKTIKQKYGEGAKIAAGLHLTWPSAATL